MAQPRRDDCARSSRCIGWSWRQKKNAIGKSRGGLTTKIHARVDALGNLLQFILTRGEAHDSTQAAHLLNPADARAYIADKAYDSDAIRRLIRDKGAEAVIPAAGGRVCKIRYDAHIYKERHTVENFFARLKRYRKIATRFAKLAIMFEGAITLAAIVDWLR